MIIKQLNIAIFFILASTTATNSEHENVVTLVSGRYNFNHPPNVEDYNPIPVAVIYDTDTVYARNSPIENYESEFHEDVYQEDVKITASTSSDNVLNISNDADKIDLTPKGRALNYQQIPVPVVYDNEFVKITINNNPNPISHSKTVHSNRNKHKENETKIQIDNENKTNIRSIENPIFKRAVQPEFLFEKVQTSNEKIKPKPIKRSRERDPVVPIIESENYVYSHRGNFHYSYESGDGTKAFESGELKYFTDDTAGESVVGGFSYIDRDGNDFSLSYTADENGYRPVGAHLPTPPPIPPAIARALLYLSTKPTSPTVVESSTSTNSWKS